MIETPGTHAHLLTIYRRLPQDYAPYGEDQRDANDDWGSDCSSGCRWFLQLDGRIGYDWGVCTNPASHRVGLLTFEHQGCRHQEPETHVPVDLSPHRQQIQ